MTAQDLSQKLQAEYQLTYRCTVNLEGTINTLLYHKLTIEEVESVIRDILDNYETT